MPVFLEPPSPRTRPLTTTEPAVHWYTESTWPEAVASRAVVNDWYNAFPDADGRLAERLRSEISRDHYQALDELYVHHILRHEFVDIRYEEGGNGPDFRVYEDAACTLGIEVLSLFEREDWDAIDRRHARLADQLCHRVRPTAGYFVDFEIEPGGPEPSPKRFATFVRDQIASLPPHESLILPPDPTDEDLPSATYDDAGVRISVRFLPMRPEAPAKTDPDARIVGTSQAIGGVVNSGQRLTDRIEAKTGARYDIAGTPFVVAVGAHDFLLRHDQVVDALYGVEAVVVATRQLTRRNDGLFGIDGGHPQGRQRRLSAVAVFSAPKLWKNPPTEVTVYENPYAADALLRPLPAEVARYGAIDVGDGRRTLGWH
jgi:hypothetical protein